MYFQKTRLFAGRVVLIPQIIIYSISVVLSFGAIYSLERTYHITITRLSLIHGNDMCIVYSAIPCANVGFIVELSNNKFFGIY
jgi:hypothetical protein